MKIGLVGESPNDTSSIQNLLVKQFPHFEYQFLLDRINGSQLDSQKTKRFLRREYEIKQPDIVIFIRDLDGILPSKEKMILRKSYFTESNSVVDKVGIYLLNIYEIEALILADIVTFNSLFGTNLEEIEDPMRIEEPKEFLRSSSKKYRESLNPKIFKELDFDRVSRCRYFNEFLSSFGKILDEY